MGKILQFDEISDYIHAMNLNIESRYSDFFIYDYERADPDSCSLLKTFRQNYFEVTLDASEGCNTLVDHFDLPTAEHRLTLISPHRLQTFQPAPAPDKPHKGYGIFFKPDFINTNPDNTTFLSDYPFFSHFNTPFISLRKDEMVFYKDIIRKIQYEYENNGSFSRDIIKNYLNILFLKVKGSYPDSGHNIKNRSREQEIYDEFSGLTQVHFLELKSVRDYAEKMHITPKHLSETIKKVTGKSALEMIHQSQINFAKAMLRQTPKTVTEIAYDLNFENPEYFSVFFKRLSGKNPTQYRNS